MGVIVPNPSCCFFLSIYLSPKQSSDFIITFANKFRFCITFLSSFQHCYDGSQWNFSISAICQRLSQVKETCTYCKAEKHITRSL